VIYSSKFCKRIGDSFTFD